MKITTHRLLFILITVVTFLFCAPLLVNVLFMYEAPCAVFEARFDSGDLLGYIGYASVGAGSISLALYSVYQTERLNKLDRNLQRQQDEFKRENTKRPFFIIDKVLVDDKPVDIDGDKGIWTSTVNEAVRLSIEIRNVGDGSACRLRLRDDSAFGKASSMDQHRLCVPRDGVYTFTASLASLRKKGVVLLLFRYENIVGCPFAQQADIQISYIPKYGKESIETDDDVLGYEIYDENVELSVSSLTAQMGVRTISWTASRRIQASCGTPSGSATRGTS